MLERRLIEVDGVVQGVGFRPYVHRLAAARGLRGFVRNEPAGVLIDIEGDSARVSDFCQSLPAGLPPLASIATLRIRQADPRDYRGFEIATSGLRDALQPPASIPSDAATCDACLAELFDPRNRRYRHPFITCTECGPRLTIVQAAPYDRERTTMAQFPLCAACRREYADPVDRRFHAEAIACPDCGPELIAYTSAGTPAGSRDAALTSALAALRAGGIVAIKALGGYHLACDASAASAVRRLRARKRREAKPFAVMVADLESAARLGVRSKPAQEALESRARPIVLVPRRAGAMIADTIAPGQDTVGVMLPATPLHHLLLTGFGGPLVMTSGNRSDEPVVIDDDAARGSLSGIADLFLTHDRAIATRCDDSVVRVVDGAPRLVRRARGFAPQGVALPVRASQPVLAAGGHLKNTACIASGTQAFLSPHVGDLDTLESRTAWRDAVDKLGQISGVTPSLVAHDLHPEYASTLLAERLCEERGIERRVAVQHHHAHIAAVVAEHQAVGPVIGVAFDGTGIGSDGAIWGGEFLVADGARFKRHGHLAYVSLPGGDAAARKPWRAAAAYANAAGLSALNVPGEVDPREAAVVSQLMKQNATSPPTSSAGRLFDAVASLLGICHTSRYEGDAAMRLEAAADPRVDHGYDVALRANGPWTADVSDIIRGVVRDRQRGRGVAEIAGAFHLTLAALIVSGCDRIREETSLTTVALGGGVFVNALLLSLAESRLSARGFRVLVPRLVPCNDGGLSLGQAYVGICALEEGLCA